MIFVWTLVAALLSVALTEAGVVTWLSLAGKGFDLTGNYWSLAVTPVIALVTLIVGLAFNRFFAADPKLFGPLYLTLWVILHAAALTLTGNPAADIAFYAEITLLVGGLVLIALYFLRWKPAAPPGQQSPAAND